MYVSLTSVLTRRCWPSEPLQGLLHHQLRLSCFPGYMVNTAMTEICKLAKRKIEPTCQKQIEKYKGSTRSTAFVENKAFTNQVSFSVLILSPHFKVFRAPLTLRPPARAWIAASPQICVLSRLNYCKWWSTCPMLELRLQPDRKYKYRGQSDNRQDRSSQKMQALANHKQWFTSSSS